MSQHYQIQKKSNKDEEQEQRKQRNNLFDNLKKYMISSQKERGNNNNSNISMDDNGTKIMREMKQSQICTKSRDTNIRKELIRKIEKYKKMKIKKNYQ